MTIRFKPINELDGRTTEGKAVNVEEIEVQKKEKSKRIKFLIEHPIGINGFTYYGEYYIGQKIHLPGGSEFTIDENFMNNLLSRNAQAATAEAKIYKSGGLTMSVSEDGVIRVVDTIR